MAGGRISLPLSTQGGHTRVGGRGVLGGPAVCHDLVTLIAAARKLSPEALLVSIKGERGTETQPCPLKGMLVHPLDTRHTPHHTTPNTAHRYTT